MLFSPHIVHLFSTSPSILKEGTGLPALIPFPELGSLQCSFMLSGNIYWVLKMFQALSWAVEHSSEQDKVLMEFMFWWEIKTGNNSCMLGVM